MVTDKQREDVCLKLFDEIIKVNHLPNMIPSVKITKEVPNMEVKDSTILANSDFVDKFTQPELAFFVGHEIAHMLYNHSDLLYALAKINIAITNHFSIDGKLVNVADTVFLNAVGKRHEYEADYLGAMFAHSIGCYAEISALEKLDNITEFAKGLDSHPLILQRIRFLQENPYPIKSLKNLREEFLLLNDFAVKSLDGKISFKDISLFVELEKKYIEEAHYNLVSTRYFLEKRKYLVEEKIASLTFSENKDALLSYSFILNSYEKLLQQHRDISRFELLHSEANSIFAIGKDIQGQLKKNVGNSIINSTKKSIKTIVKSFKGEENEYDR